MEFPDDFILPPQENITVKLTPIEGSVEGQSDAEEEYEKLGWYNDQVLALMNSAGLQSAEGFVFRPQDVVIAGFIKTGTSWLCEILYNLYTEEQDENNGDRDILEKRVPLVEASHLCAAVLLKDKPDVRVMRTHLFHNNLPKSYAAVKPRIIHIRRNPKDTCVSLYHFGKMVKFFRVKGTFEQFFKYFMTGEVYYGPWWKHTQSYWAHRDEENIFHITYEELVQDFEGTVRRMSEFLGVHVSDEKLERMSQKCSFDHMKKDKSTNYQWLDKWDATHKGQGTFMRKGKVGDWKKHFNEEMNREMEEFIEKELTSRGLTYQYTLDEPEELGEQ